MVLDISRAVCEDSAVSNGRTARGKCHPQRRAQVNNRG
nr:MAG TPA: hypothetical protein [Caudoviricetes sp.]